MSIQLSKQYRKIGLAGRILPCYRTAIDTDIASEFDVRVYEEATALNIQGHMTDFEYKQCGLSAADAEKSVMAKAWVVQSHQRVMRQLWEKATEEAFTKMGFNTQGSRNHVRAFAVMLLSIQLYSWIFLREKGTLSPFVACRGVENISETTVDNLVRALHLLLEIAKTKISLLSSDQPCSVYVTGRAESYPAHVVTPHFSVHDYLLDNLSPVQLSRFSHNARYHRQLRLRDQNYSCGYWPNVVFGGNAWDRFVELCEDEAAQATSTDAVS